MSTAGMSTGKDFVGRRALVTGAASGIGREVAAQLAARGARVLAADIDADGLASLCRDCGDAVIGAATDVTDEAAVAAAVQAAVAEFGGLDIAFNVAGAGRSAPILDTDVKDWDFVVDLVQKGVFLSTKHEAKAMLASGASPGNPAAIVNVASLNAHMPLQRGSSYATAKAGVESFSRNAALELTPLGIRVNVVLPGFTRTAATEPLFGLPDLLADFKKRILVGRPATPAEIAAPCLFLASDEASYITGTSLVIDGGWEITNYPYLSDYFGS
jgi:NAD(P)-dependent dehydrogenase (short-subunit alcohol dehydrogenase family)